MVSVFIVTEVLSSKLYHSITAKCQGRGKQPGLGFLALEQESTG